jgi:hypothetical protein
MDIGSIDNGDFFVKFRLSDRESDFKWVLVAIYGAALSVRKVVPTLTSSKRQDLSLYGRC